jgi:hypothetical protein
MENEDEVTPTEQEEETETQTEETEQVEDEEDTPEPDDELIRLRKENADKNKEIDTLRNQKEHWKKKANGSKGDEKAPKKASDSLTTEDVLAITNAGLTEIEDVNLARRYASFENMSLAQALKDPFVQMKLSNMKEARNVAQATDKGGKPSTSKLNGDQALEKVREGKIFGANSPEGNALFEKKFGKRK